MKTTDEFKKFKRDYFGHLKIWEIILLVIVWPFGIAYLLFTGLPQYIKEKNCIKKLKQSGQLEQVIRDFYSGNRRVFLGGTVVFADNFIFLKEKRKIIPYQDILWAYKVNTKTSINHIIPTGSYLSVNLINADYKALSTPSLGEDDANGILYEVSRHNPDCMIGYTSENQKRFDMMKNPSLKQ